MVRRWIMAGVALLTTATALSCDLDGSIYPGELGTEGTWNLQGPVPAAEKLWDIWGDDYGYAIAVGADSTMIRWDGNRWRPFEGPSLSGVTNVWTSGPDDIYAAVWGPTRSGVFHYDGTRWDGVVTSYTPVAFSVWGVSPAQVYLWATAGTVGYFDGADWRPIASGETGDISDLWARSPDDVYTIGPTGNVSHYDGASWTPVDVGIADPDNAPSMIEGDRNGHLLISGKSTYYFDGSAWTEIPHTGPGYVAPWIVDIMCVGIDDYYAIGAYSFFRFDGTAWNEVARLPEGRGYGQLNAMWARGTRVWATAEDGQTWLYYRDELELEPGTNAITTDIWGSSARDVYAVGNNGWILHYDGEQWSPQAVLDETFLGSIWGVGPRAIYVVAGGGDIYRYDGESWKFYKHLPIGIYDLWGTGTNHIFAAGSGGVSYYDGNNWNLWPRSGTLFGVGGTAPDDVYAVGGTSIVHYDGNDWTVQDPGLGAGVLLTDVWASPAHGVYAGGAYGLFHLEDGAWRKVKGLTCGSVNRIWGPPDSDKLYVLCSGYLEYYDGERWTAYAVGELAGLGEPLTMMAVWGSNDRHVFLGGEDGLFLQFSR